jgi:hypothetical protein
VANWTTERARVAWNERHGNRAAADAARRAMRVARADEYLRKLVESAPPLRPEDVERLRALLPLGRNRERQEDTGHD